MSKNLFCNKCGKELDIFDLHNHFHIEGNIGYGSEHDLERLSLNLCCECMDELINSCKISPVK